MNKLAKIQQRNMLIGIIVGTVALVALLYYFGVAAKQDELSKTRRNTAQMRDKLKGAENIMHQGEEISAQLQARQQLLEKRESTLAPDRDAYAWVIGTINPFIQSRKGVNIYHYTQPEFSDTGLMPGFPYRWATFHLDGMGYYHDFGKFFADLENSFPYFRIQNLTVAPTGTSEEVEKLNFSFELVAPVKPSDSK